MNSWTDWNFENVLGISLSEVLIIVLIAILIVGPIIWTRMLASRTGRSAAAWGFAAFLFGPLVLVVLYAVSWNDLKKLRNGGTY